MYFLLDQKSDDFFSHHPLLHGHIRHIVIYCHHLPFYLICGGAPHQIQPHFCLISTTCALLYTRMLVAMRLFCLTRLRLRAQLTSLTIPMLRRRCTICILRRRTCHGWRTDAQDVAAVQHFGRRACVVCQPLSKPSQFTVAVQRVAGQHDERQCVEQLH